MKIHPLHDFVIDPRRAQSAEPLVMSSNKRGVRRLDLVDCGAVPAVLALRMLIDDRRDQKGQEQTELQVWESEGGSPTMSEVASSSC